VSFVAENRGRRRGQLPTAMPQAPCQRYNYLIHNELNGCDISDSVKGIFEVRFPAALITVND